MVWIRKRATRRRSYESYAKRGAKKSTVWRRLYARVLVRTTSFVAVNAQSGTLKRELRLGRVASTLSTQLVTGRQP